MTRERVVIDTNVLISGLLSVTSAPARAVDKAVTNAQLVATTETLHELIEKLLSPKFDRSVTRLIDPVRSVERKRSEGGTGPRQVAWQLARWKRRLA